VAGLALAALSAFAAAQPAATAATCPPPVMASTPAPPPQDRGLLWRLERDGRVSWLYGTVHIGRPHWAEPGPRLRAALDAADALALEVDPADPALLAAMQQLPAAAPLAPALQLRLQQALVRACLPPALLSALHPVLQLATLTVVEGRWLGLDAAYASETLLAAQARRRGLPVVALETAQDQMAALLPAPDAPLGAPLERGLAQLESGAARTQMQRLVQAWEQGDLATLERYPDWCDCVHGEDDRAAMQQLNDARNPPLADGISARHAAGQRVLAAVGALHMTGPQALPRLLADRGFRVQAVWPPLPAPHPVTMGAPTAPGAADGAAPQPEEPR
jgi:uncharacterized protein YbaP (TraB family)